MIFLLHHTHEGRVGLCHEDDGACLADNAIIARLTFEQAVGLYDDLHETFETCHKRGQVVHPDNCGEPDHDDD